MIDKIISFSIRNKLVVAIFTLALVGAGLYSMSTVNLGSVPDITNNQVQVMTVSPNLATEDIEQFVTFPVELAMGNLPGVTEIRSVSRFGLSVVTIVFEDNLGIYRPRQLVQEKLIEVREEIPQKFGNPHMGPITTGLGEIYQYTLMPQEGFEDKYSTTELRSIQDWIVARQLTMIDGVVEVNAFGGNVKQYEVAINPEKLNSLGISISEIYTALANNNVNAGGAYIEKNGMAHFIRGEGLIRSLEDIKDIVIKTENGIPITIGNAAEKVGFGRQTRYGAFTQNGHEAVGGMILMLKDANANKVIAKVQERIKSIQKSLPEGLKIVPFVERNELIERTTSTVKTNLMEGALIVIFALVLLLGSLRGGIVTATTIPLSLLFAFILMRIFGVSANLMSLGAIDFGIIIDGAVIIIEGTVFEIQKRIKNGQLKFVQSDMDALATTAGSNMMGSAFFGQVIILIVFAPILFLTGIEGKMFQPMAFTFGFAMIGAIVLCLTYVPMMSALMMKPFKNENHWLRKIEMRLEKLSDIIIGSIQRRYQKMLQNALNAKGAIIATALALFGVAVFTFSRMGGEFIPQLDEGDLAMQALIRPGSNLNESIETSEKIENILLDQFPEVQKVVARIGVADIPTDPMPMDIADMVIVLEKDMDKWTSAESKKELIEKMKSALSRELIGVNMVFAQPVELRFNELLTGVREDIAIKLFGEDLDILSQKAEEIAQLAQTVPGAEDVSAERISGLPQINVRFNRRKIAQYGLDIEKLNTYLSTAFAGGVAGEVFEGEKRFDLVVRFANDYRKNIDHVRNMYVELPSGNQLPLSELADVNYESGPMQISRENTFRRTYVGINIRGRDVESVVSDIQQKLNENLVLPPGYYITYGGEFENLERAKSRLAIVVPIALLLIFLLLYFALKSFKQSALIFIAIPLAAIGGIFALWLRNMPFSISAGVGFIVLFGVAVLNGLVLMNRFNQLKQQSQLNLNDRIFQGTKERIRPIFLTATTDIFGFLPMAFSSSAGAEVQRPLATVVIGGMITATLLTLVVLPILYAIIEKRKSKIMNFTKIATSVILVLIALAAPTQILAQNNDVQIINLQEAQERAVAKFPKIKAAQFEIDKQKALKKTAWNFGNTQIFTGTEEASSMNSGVYTKIGVAQNNIDLFGIAPKMQAQKTRVALAQNAMQLSIAQVKREVKIAWGEAFVAQQKLMLFSDLDSIFEEISRAAKVQHEVQEISKLAFLATTNQANEVKIQQEIAQRDWEIALQKLNLWMVSDTVFTVPQELINDETAATNLSSDSLRNHPALQIFQEQVSLANREIKTQRANFLPKLQGQYGWQDVQGQSGFYTYQVGLSFPLIFNAQLGKTQQAKIDQYIAEQNLKQAKLELNTAYQTAFQEYAKWQKTWQFYSENALPLAQEQRNGALVSFESGEIDYVVFLQNIREAIRLEINAWDAYQSLLTSQFELEFFTKNTTR